VFWPAHRLDSSLSAAQSSSAFTSRTDCQRYSVKCIVDRRKSNCVDAGLQKEIGESVTRLLLVDNPQSAVIENRDDRMEAGLTPQPRTWYQLWRN
jgi:hypothetical protein